MPLFLDVGLQRKLAVGSVDDPLEHEADRVADAVASSGNFDSSSHGRSARVGRYPRTELGFESAGIQRRCACGGSSSGECEECKKQEEEQPTTPSIQRRVSGNGNGSGASEAPPIVQEASGVPRDTLSIHRSVR